MREKALLLFSFLFIHLYKKKIIMIVLACVTKEKIGCENDKKI